MESAILPLSKITLVGAIRGTDGELKMLMESMRAVGQLQDIVLNSRLETIAGRRRYRAAERLGWKKARVIICANLDEELAALRAERDENTCRVGLSRKEILEIGRKYADMENPEAAARKAANQAKKGEGEVGKGKLPSPKNKGQTRDKVAEALADHGVEISGTTWEHMQAVVDAAEEYPDRYLDLGERVQEDKQPVDPVYQEFKARQEIYDAADEDERFADIAEQLTEDKDTEAAQEELERRKDGGGEDAARDLYFVKTELAYKLAVECQKLTLKFKVNGEAFESSSKAASAWAELTESLHQALTA